MSLPLPHANRTGNAVICFFQDGSSIEQTPSVQEESLEATVEQPAVPPPGEVVERDAEEQEVKLKLAGNRRLTLSVVRLHSMDLGIDDCRVSLALY